MPTKRELEKYTEKLEKLIIELDTDRENAYDAWEKAEGERLELIDLLIEKNKLLKEAEDRILLDKEKKGKVGLSDVTRALINMVERDREKVDTAMKIIATKAKGAKTRTSNSLRKYELMLPYYKNGLSKNMSRTQAARYAHVKAREVDETIPAKISDRQLTRELNKRFTISLIKKK